MKINIVTKEDGTIESWTSYPFDESKPYINIKDPYSIHLGIDKIIDGKLVRDSKTYKKTLELQEKRYKIDEFKKKLSETDYKLFKYLEGELSEEDYQEVKSLRQEWRNQINTLEEELNERDTN